MAGQRTKRTAAHDAAIEVCEGWYCEGAAVRGELRQIVQAAGLITAREDLAAAELIETLAGEALERMAAATAEWERFWQMVYAGEDPAAVKIIELAKARRKGSHGNQGRGRVGG
jgi:hypothetical protein